MKAIKILFGVIIVLALIGGSVVVAQEVDPPLEGEPSGGMYSIPEWDETIWTRDGKPPPEPVEGDFPIQPVIDFGASTSLAVAQYFNEESTRAVYPAGPTLIIADSPEIERYPSVAHGGEHYMVVYDLLGNIYAAVYSNEGIYQTTHTVAECLVPASGFSNPSVAYEASSGWFLVAYETFESIPANIRVNAVSPLTGAEPSWEHLSTTADWNPSVACNPDNGSCLVAYETDFKTMIKGVHYHLDSTGITGISGIPFDLTDVNNVWYPNVAWGKGTGTYLVTYNWTDGFGEDFPMFTHVHDVPVPGPGNQFLHGNEYMVIPGALGPYDKYNYGVTYDPCTQHFVATFHYDWWGLGTNYDVWAVAVHGQLPITADPFPVAYSPANERFGAISFVTDDHLTPACGSMDKLVIAYLNEDVGIMAAELRGNNNPADPRYHVVSMWWHLVVQFNTPTILISDPIAISSGSQRAEMFIVYRILNLTSLDYDIWGQIVEVRERYYYPLFQR